MTLVSSGMSVTRQNRDFLSNASPQQPSALQESAGGMDSGLESEVQNETSPNGQTVISKELWGDIDCEGIDVGLETDFGPNRLPAGLEQQGLHKVPSFGTL
uniref:Uncharacterized protein n=1 Tax=Tetraselmis sp. GSL018 TaxID=582737 RepID=A0A061QVQ8_9CHLO